MKTKCLDTLEWFIKKSQIDKWSLDYDKNMDVKTFGIIDIDEYDGYVFYSSFAWWEKSIWSSN